MKHLSKVVCVLLALMLPLCALAETPGPIPGMIDEKVEITVSSETDLPGHFFLSFPFSRNLIMLDGKGNVVWEKYEPFANPDQPGAFWVLRSTCWTAKSTTATKIRPAPTTITA